MKKHEIGSPKDIANKIKAKGLQKLRWYCQMCQKQCRDENGFKCHTMSESHHRQLLLFADNANKHMDQFSKDFSNAFLQLLKRRFGTKRISANKVYQDYIADRNHIHMNATTWLTLTEYVKWLGRTGKCVVDETEQGWFITYIDRDPEVIAAQEKQEKKEKMDKDDEERMRKLIEKQVRKAKSSTDDSTEEFKQPLERAEDGALLFPALSLKKVPQTDKKLNIKQKITSDDEPSTSFKRKGSETPKEEPFKKLKKESDNEGERDKSKGWLREGLSVMIVTKSLGEKYYKAKGTVKELTDREHFIGTIKLNSPEKVEGHIIKIDQEHLETVIPSIGREVMLLWGKHNGEIALIEKVRKDDFCVDVELRDSKQILKRIPYEQICKYVG